MNGVLLGPGSALPAWAEALDRETFGDTWGTLEEDERLWMLPEQGWARWRAIPVAGEAELVRLAVAPSARRQGLGRALLRASEAGLCAAGIDTLHLEVRVSNLAARALYEAEGWREVGLRRGYYRDSEDAALYTKAT